MKRIGTVRELESAARSWLGSLGLPCWTCPMPEDAPNRYGLLLISGRRVLVRPWPVPGASFEDLARARCSYLLAMKSAGESGSPTAGALMTLADMRLLGHPLHRPDLSVIPTRHPSDLVVLEGRPRHPRIDFLLGSLKLLLAGEGEPPPPDPLAASAR